MLALGPLGAHPWLQRFRGRPALITLGLILILAISSSVWYVRSGRAGHSSSSLLGAISTVKQPETPPTVPDSLSGTPVDAGIANRRPLAIMIENHPDARPQFGLSAASVIYEAVAEGGITRFMALYGSNDSDKVGPVRSARTYYLDWALEYDAGYAHVGGNIDALDLIPSLGVNNLDQFSIGDAAFWREAHDGVASEHTMYTDTAKLRGIMDQEFGTDPRWTKPSFKQPADREQRGPAGSITIDFSGPQFKVAWAYDPETNRYARTMAGAPHTDGSGDQLIADNVIVQTVAAQSTLTRINEAGLRMSTVGSGQALVFRDGQRIEGTWEKADHASPTIFKDADGQPIARNPGTTWIEVVQPDMAISS